MLQELTVSEGPKVPTSIQSYQDSIESGTPTLMRMAVDHGILEFSDVGCHMSRISGLLAHVTRQGLIDPSRPD